MFPFHWCQFTEQRGKGRKGGPGALGTPRVSFSYLSPIPGRSGSLCRRLVHRAGKKATLGPVSGRAAGALARGLATQFVTLEGLFPSSALQRRCDWGSLGSTELLGINVFEMASRTFCPRLCLPLTLGGGGAEKDKTDTGIATSLPPSCSVQIQLPFCSPWGLTESNTLGRNLTLGWR